MLRNNSDKRVYEVKPIPTIFNGIEYKSRLEARWAVFFNILNIEALYEYEGYQLPSGWYLPDFYVPSMKTWFEVKPSELTEKEYKLCEELSATTHMLTVFLTGNMSFRSTTKDEGFQVVGDYYYYFCTCPVCGKVGIEYEGRGDRVCWKECVPHKDKGHSSNDPRLVQAFEYASKYQFKY